MKRTALLSALLAVLLAAAAPAAQAAYGDDFGLVPGSFWAGACQLPAVDGSEPVDSSVTPPVSAAAVEKRDCHRSSSLVPQTAVPVTQAGAHPDATATFELKPITTHPSPVPPLVGNYGPYPDGHVKDIVVDLPPGWSGNPEAAPKCEATEWIVGFCPVPTQVGIVDFRVSAQATDSSDPANPLFGVMNPSCELWAPVASTYPQFSFPEGPVTSQHPTSGTVPGGPGARCRVPLNNMRPAFGEVASFGFNFHFGINVFTQPVVRTDGDFGVQLRSTNIPEWPAVSKVTATMWGVPGDPVHDPFRFRKGYDQNPGSVSPALPPGQPWPVSEPVLPLITNPTSCDDSPAAREITLRTRSWQQPGKWLSYRHLVPATTGCDRVPFEPELALSGASAEADAPTGLVTDLTVPQNDDLPAELANDPAGAAAHWKHPDGRGLGTAHLDKTVVTLPEGFSLNPAAAGGLEACGDDQIGLTSERPIRFDNDDPFDGRGSECPLGSKIGTAEVFTPLLPSSPPGAPNLAGEVVLGAPRSTNPTSGEMFRLFVVVRNEARGLLAKIAGSAVADPITGQLTATFADSPQVAFEHLRVELKGGQRGLLATPRSCADHAFAATLTPWSATAPVGEPAGSPVSRSGTLATSAGCAVPFSPAFTAGVSDDRAGGSGAFALRFSRADGEAWVSRITTKLPEGLLAKIKDVPRCSSAQAEEGACPAASRIGQIEAGAGAGQPFFLERPGDVYLTASYKGAPFGLAFDVPVEAGPFRGEMALKPVRVRAALHIDPRTTEVSVVSDALPQIWHGIPLRLREATVRIDRPGFMVNPTDCDAKRIEADFASDTGQSAQGSVHFAAERCGELGFKPSLALRLSGGTKRGAYQALRAVVRPRPGDANIGRTVVRMPRSAFLAQEHIRTVCTRVQFAADACPKRAIYGRAVAWSPLLDQPLIGNVYLRSSDNPLPDLVADLRGPADQPIRVELVGRTDSVRGALRNTFDVVPDAPVSYFRLQLFGGNRALIVNSRDICRGRYRAAVRMDAQNGMRRLLRPPLTNPRCAKRAR